MTSGNLSFSSFISSLNKWEYLKKIYYNNKGYGNMTLLLKRHLQNIAKNTSCTLSLKPNQVVLFPKSDQDPRSVAAHSQLIQDFD